MSESGIKFKEGHSYEFLIKNLVEMSGMEKYYVLQDETGGKQLLKSDFYDKYNLQIEQRIKCRIDHINCSGRIFLEPEHPYYKEGEVYEFVIEEIELIRDKLDIPIYEIKVRDVFGEIAFCRMEQKIPVYYSKGHVVKCRVERVKKGSLYLSSVDDLSHEDYERDRYYTFTIIDIRILNDDLRYYILENTTGKHFILRYDYYQFHGFKKGTDIECEVQKMNSEGYYVLEPKHPYYNLNQKYLFDFVKTANDINTSVTDKIEVTVKDTYGQEVKFLSDDLLFKGSDISEKFECEVIGIKKGKPVLSYQVVKL
jgi:hypothetical protein